MPFWLYNLALSKIFKMGRGRRKVLNFVKICLKSRWIKKSVTNTHRPVAIDTIARREIRHWLILQYLCSRSILPTLDFMKLSYVCLSKSPCADFFGKYPNHLVITNNEWRWSSKLMYCLMNPKLYKTWLQTKTTKKSRRKITFSIGNLKTHYL